MIGLHEGKDYKLYKIYIWGGLALLAVYILTLGFLDLPQTGNTVAVLAMAPVTLWFLGILLYWWWVFLFKGMREVKAAVAADRGRIPEVRDLKSKRSLHTAMALYAGDVENLLQAEKSGRWPVVIWFGMQNLLALWIFGNFWIWVWFHDNLPTVHFKKIVAPGVIVILILFFVVTPILLLLGGRGGVAAYLKPLGLLPAESPHPGTWPERFTDMVSGTAVYTGMRLGRPVLVDDRNRGSRTWVQADAVPFEVHSRSGKLVPGDGAPEPVKSSLKKLRRAKRWRGIKVTGFPEGICIERESRRQNMWLYDLWLIERLLEALGRSG